MCSGAKTRDGSNPKRTPAVRAGDVAKALGIGVQTLHYYERERLIPAPSRSDSGYRLYSPGLVDRVRFIRKAQALGLSLDEIREIVQLADVGSSPCGRVQAALEDKLREVDRRLRELRGFRRDLAAIVSRSREDAGRETQRAVCAIVEDASPLPEASVQIVRPLRRRHAR